MCMNYCYLFCRKPWQKYHLNRYRRVVRQANELESTLTELSNGNLAQQIEDLRSRAQAVGNIKAFLSKALAIGREISRRTLNMRHFNVQLMVLC